VSTRRQASLKPKLNQIRTWVGEGATDIWIAHQLGSTPASIAAFRRQHKLLRPGASGSDAPATGDEAAPAAAATAAAPDGVAAPAEDPAAAPPAPTGDDAPAPPARPRRSRSRRSAEGAAPEPGEATAPPAADLAVDAAAAPSDAVEPPPADEAAVAAAAPPDSPRTTRPRRRRARAGTETAAPVVDDQRTAEAPTAEAPAPEDAAPEAPEGATSDGGAGPAAAADAAPDAQELPVEPPAVGAPVFVETADLPEAGIAAEAADDPAPAATAEAEPAAVADVGAATDSTRGADATDEEAASDRPRRRRGRRGGRRRVGGPDADTPVELEGVFDHGQDGYGLWLDGAVRDAAVYRTHWLDRRELQVRMTPDEIVIRRAGDTPQPDGAG
jgi:hypothetical protein